MPSGRNIIPARRDDSLAINNRNLEVNTGLTDSLKSTVNVETTVRACRTCVHFDGLSWGRFYAEHPVPLSSRGCRRRDLSRWIDADSIYIPSSLREKPGSRAQNRSVQRVCIHSNDRAVPRMTAENYPLHNTRRAGCWDPGYELLVNELTY